jgi:uncharacterized membrane protein
MKKFHKNKLQIFFGLCIGCIFGLCIGYVLGDVIGVPVLGIITGVSSGAIGGSLMAMFI